MNPRTVEVICFILCSSIGVICNGNFVHHPLDQTVPLNDNATFYCESPLPGEIPQVTDVVMLVTSRIGEVYLSTSTADIESLRMRMAFLTVGPDHNQFNLTIVATEQNNETTVTCKIVATHTVMSNSSILIVQGPPSPPGPELLSINSTLMIVRWASPFSAYPIIAYHIRVTEQEITGRLRSDAEYELLPNMTEIEYPLHELYPDTNANLPSCTVLEFIATASSDLGESTEGTTMGSYPIAPDQFNDSSVTDTVTFDRDGSPMVTLEFLLPAGCTDQEAVYELNITYLPSNTTEVFGPYLHLYAEGAAVRLPLEDPFFLEGQQYILVVIVQTGGSEVSSSPYIFSTTLRNKNPGLSEQAIIAISVCGGVALIIIALAIILVSVCCRNSRRKSSIQIANGGGHLTVIPPPLPKRHPGMVNNPLYAGQMDYETIDDCQRHYNHLQHQHAFTATQSGVLSTARDNVPPVSPRKPYDFANQLKEAHHKECFSMPVETCTVDRGSEVEGLASGDQDCYTVMNPAGNVQPLTYLQDPDNETRYVTSDC